MSVRLLAVTVAAIRSPTRIDRAVDPSCARTIVNVSDPIDVTRTISAFVDVGTAPIGHTVALNGGAWNNTPAPLCTVRVVPVVGGDGARSTVEIAKFLCGSN